MDLLYLQLTDERKKGRKRVGRSVGRIELLRREASLGLKPSPGTSRTQPSTFQSIIQSLINWNSILEFCKEIRWIHWAPVGHPVTPVPERLVSEVKHSQGCYFEVIFSNIISLVPSMKPLSTSITSIWLDVPADESFSHVSLTGIKYTFTPELTWFCGGTCSSTNMSADSNSSNKSFWPVKTALKEKIVVLYDALLNVCRLSCRSWVMFLAVIWSSCAGWSTVAWK